MNRSFALFLLVLPGCQASPPSSASVSRASAALTAAASLPGLHSLHRDIALICDEPIVASDAPHHIPDCDAAILASDNRFAPIGRGDLLSAQRLSGGRMLLQTRDLQLLVRDQAGNERVLARGGTNPRATADGRRIVYSQYAEGTDWLEPGLASRVVVMDLEKGTRRVLDADLGASSPALVPGTEEVLFVSGRTGVASLWLSAPGKAPRQITNVGKRMVDGDFVPVPSKDVEWIPDTRKMVFTAYYGTPDLWTVNIDTGEARRVGPGSMPRLEGGDVVAIGDDGALLRYAMEVL